MIRRYQLILSAGLIAGGMLGHGWLTRSQPPATHYQALRVSDRLVWRMNTKTGEMAVCYQGFCDRAESLEARAGE